MRFDWTLNRLPNKSVHLWSSHEFNEQNGFMYELKWSCVFRLTIMSIEWLYLTPSRSFSFTSTHTQVVAGESLGLKDNKVSYWSIFCHHPPPLPSPHYLSNRQHKVSLGVHTLHLGLMWVRLQREENRISGQRKAKQWTLSLSVGCRSSTHQQVVSSWKAILQSYT